MVFLHGYGQSRTGWMTTPDGRDGWSHIIFEERSWSIFRSTSREEAKQVQLLQ